MLSVILVALLLFFLLIIYLNTCPCSCQSYFDTLKMFLREQTNSTGFMFSALIALFSVLKLKISRDEMFERLFNDFNKRFDLLNENLNKIRNNANQKELKLVCKSNNEIFLTTEDVIKDYLNLCSEEYLWYRKCRIDPKVWVAWEDGMFFYLAHKNIRMIVSNQSKEDESYYGLLGYLTDERYQAYKAKQEKIALDHKWFSSE